MHVTNQYCQQGQPMLTKVFLQKNQVIQIFYFVIWIMITKAIYRRQSQRQATDTAMIMVIETVMVTGEETIMFTQMVI